MSRIDEAAAELLKTLRTLKLATGSALVLYDVGVPLSQAGFTQDETLAALYRLQNDKVIELIEGNRLRLIQDIGNG